MIGNSASGAGNPVADAECAHQPAFCNDRARVGITNRVEDQRLLRRKKFPFYGCKRCRQTLFLNPFPDLVKLDFPFL